MSRRTLARLKGAVAVLLILLAYGIVGRDDYAEAVAQERYRAEVGQ